MKSAVDLLTLVTLIYCLCTPALSASATDPYTLIWYPELLERTVELSKHPHLFRVENIFEKYPAITKVRCGDEDCISPVIEMTNFENSPEYIKALPTLLIVAGIHGNEVIGTNVIYRFFDMILKYKTLDPFYFSMLNNLRIIFLPIANPSGYFRKIREEVHLKNNQEIKIDPNRDFDWDNKGGCYLTCASQMIGHLYKDNLILGTLTYHGGEHSITYPWGTFVHEGHSHSRDHAAYSAISTMLRDAASNAPKFNLDTFVVGTMEEIVYNVNGGYEDWAYGGSYEQKYLTMDCLPEETVYAKKFLMSDDSSNRAFVFLIEAGDQKTPDEGTLGNELYAVDKNGDGAENGNVTRSILILKQFIEVMRPFPIVTRMYTDPDTNTDVSSTSQAKPDLLIEIDIRGCKTVDSVQLTDPKPLDQSFTADPPSFEHGTQSNMILLRVKFPEKHDIWNWNIDLKLDIRCDGAWLGEFTEHTKGKHPTPESHFFRARLNDGYHASRRGYSFKSGNLHNFKITNFSMKRIGEAVMFHKYFNELEMLYHTEIELESDGKAVLKMSYDKTEQMATLESVDSSLDLTSMETSQQSVNQDVSVKINNGKAENQIDRRILANNGTNDDFSVRFYQETNFYHLATMSQILKRHTLTPTKTTLADYKSRSTDLPAIEPYLTMSIGSSIKIHPTVFFNLVGKRFTIDRTEASLSQAPVMKGLVTVDTKAPGYKYSTKGPGLSVPSEGLWCSSIEQDGLVGFDKKGREFVYHVSWVNQNTLKLQLLIEKLELVPVISASSKNSAHTMGLKEDWRPTKNFIKKLNEQKAGSKMTEEDISKNFAMYESEIPRMNFMTMGLETTFQVPETASYTFGSCYLERGSDFSVSGSLGEMFEDLKAKVADNHGDVIHYADEDVKVVETMYLSMKLAIIALVLVVVTLTIFLCVYCRKKVSNFDEGTDEGMEIGEIQRAEDADHPYFNN